MTVSETLHGSARMAIVGLVSSLALLTGCGGDEAATPKPPSVTVDVVSQATVPITFEFTGSLEAVKSIEVIPQVSGVLQKRNFDEGAFVEKDAALYVIDPRPMQAALDENRAQLEKDRAHLAYLKKEAERYSALYDQGVASEEQRDSAVAEAKEFEATARLDVASVERAELDLGYAHITAPFAGRIQETKINEGELVTANETVLTELVQVDPVYAVFSISRPDVAEIQRHAPEGTGPEALQAFTATVELPDGTTYAKPGHVDFLSAQTDPSTDTLDARAVFENTIVNESLTLIPGQYARVHLTVGEQKDAVLVPQKAVVEAQAEKHVLVVDAKDVVEMRPIEVGRTVGDAYVVEKGVKAGERVIVAGFQKAKPKATVTPVPQAEKTSGAAQP